MKNLATFLTCASLIVGIPTAALAEDNIADKAINEQRVSRIAVYGSAQSNKVITDKTVLGEEAKRIITRGTGNNWDAAAQSVTTGKIKAGDEIICLVFLKAVETADNAPARVALQLQQSSAPYTAEKREEINIGKEWNQYQITLTASKDYGRGEASFVVQLNFAAQTIDVGPMFILNMAKTTKGSR
jgi:hypothetical protein